MNQKADADDRECKDIDVSMSRALRSIFPKTQVSVASSWIVAFALLYRRRAPCVREMRLLSFLGVLIQKKSSLCVR